MHIGIVAPCSSGPLADLLPESQGADLGCGAYFMTTLVRHLIRRGKRVSVITLSPQLSDRRVLTGPRLTYYVYPMRTKRRTRDLYKVEREGLTEGIYLAKPDVLHAHWTYEFALACLDSGLPTLVTSHDNAVNVLRFAKSPFMLGRLYLQIRVIRKARFLTAVSPYLVNSHRLLTKTGIELIPNPVELYQQARSRCDQSSRPRIATVLNGWSTWKNPKAAIRAFNLLLHKKPDAELYMYGIDFEDGGIASHWAASKGLSQNIHFCGFVPPDDLHTKLREMSILLHPALEEACPLVLLEAMALGVPVLAGMASGGVPWVLDHGRAGFLTDTRDPKKIARALLTCIEDPEEREMRRRNAYERVRSLFSPETVAEQYEKAYEKVLSSL
jgi:glycosyltransferase involved in cell wall biosynthesis